ncbi:VWA domain-containing protein [uncultured Cohaesibacter sp.]|uniref:VWA domain-containing protein n=1 Tax=uncultured Cohaesibacter sp. TaxID=1002546 RepID=UPI0029C6CF8B|nr:VWA domain-containing protein [uncultured Cohaesibacter sp.]
MAAGIRSELVNRFNLTDYGNGLYVAYGVHSISLGGHSYIYVTGQNSSIVAYELEADGSMTRIEMFSDDANSLLSGVATLTSATIGGSTYLFANSRYDDSISSFKVNADGSLTFVQSLADTAALELDGTAGSMSVIASGSNQFLIASGYYDDGVSVFRIASDGTLVNTANYDDTGNSGFGFDGAMGVASAVIGGNSFIFVAGQSENAVSVLRLNSNGTLTLTNSLTDSADLNLATAVEVETATVNGTTYLFVSGYSDDGISVFSVNGNGILTNVFNTSSSNNSVLDGVWDLESFTLDGQTYLMANGSDSNTLSYFSVGDDGSLTLVDSFADSSETYLGSTDYSTFVTVEGRSFVVATGGAESGLSVFELGVENPINGTNGVDFLEGTDLADTINGGRGDDIINGYDGADTISGGAGSDVILGGAGDDYILGDDDNLQTLTDTVTVPSTKQQLSVSATLPATTNASSIDVSGFISRDAVQSSEFNLVYVIDISGSMSGSFYGNETVADMNGDGYSNTLLDGAIAAYESLTQSLIAGGLAGSSLAVVAFESSASVVYNGTVGGDVSSVLESLTDKGTTNFEAALQQTIAALNSMGPGENHVFFMSDGAPDNTYSYTDEVDTLLAANGLNANIRAIGLGSGANIEVLDLLDDGIDNDSSERVLTPSALTTSLSGAPVQANEVARIEILVNGRVVETVLPNEFTSTPLGLRYSATVDGLSTSANDRIAVRMVASDPAHTTAQVGVTLTNGAPGDGNDVIFGNDGNDTIQGHGGNDRLHGGAGDDTLFGMSGADVIFGGAGADDMTGGAGNDIYYVDMGRDTVTEYARGGIDKINSHISFSLAEDGANVEQLNLLGSANLNGTGNALANVISGNGGRNLLYGYGGNDKLYGNNGNDVLDGGNGNDILNGGGGNDVLNGGGGNDKLYGGAGLDVMRGGAGNDIYFVDKSGDMVVEAGKSGVDQVNSSASFSLATNGANVEKLNLTGKANLDGTGNGMGNQITGNDGNNILKGLNGHDTMSGFKGNDTLIGGNGNDRLNGNVGNDVLQGNLGADVMNGGTGMDRMYAGIDKARDVFDFNAISESRVGAAVRDKIFQFDSGEDKVDLAGIDANNSVGGNQAFSFNGHVAKAYSVWWVDTGSDIVLRGDVNGNLTADFEIQINNINGLNAGDVIL